MARKAGLVKRRRKSNQTTTVSTAKGKSKELFSGRLSHTSPVPNALEADLKITDFFPTILATNVPEAGSYEEVSDVKPQVLQRIFLRQKDKVGVAGNKPIDSSERLTVEDASHKTNGTQDELNPAAVLPNLMSVADKKVEADAEEKPKLPKAKRKLNVSQSVNQENHKLTEYFTIRRSERKTKTIILEEKQRNIEEAILTGREEGLAVHTFPGKGRGVIATRLFRKSEFVVEYAGDLINLAEARTREVRYAADQNTGCYMYYFQYKNHSYCIDATAESNRLGRLVNHSRSGNLAPKILEIKDRPHLVLVARRDIVPGEEFLYDYGDRSKDSLKHHPWLAS